MRYLTKAASILFPGLLFTLAASATSVQSLSFEELTDRSELVVTGQIVRSWSDWDASHHNIWTHHELAVDSVQKGTAAATVVLSEPGGVVGGLQQTIAGTVQYQAGEKVVVFLERMPNGYLRTTGWGQGKYTIDASGHVHAAASLGKIDMVNTGTTAPSAPRFIDGITAVDLASQVLARVRSRQVRSAQ